MVIATGPLRVWLAGVKPDTDQIQLCVDVNTTLHRYVKCLMWVH
jgi:hypothetical protein